MEGKARSVAHGPEKQPAEVLGFAKKILLAIKPSIHSSTRKTRGWYTLVALPATPFQQRRAVPKRAKPQAWPRYESPFWETCCSGCASRNPNSGEGMVNRS